MRCPFCGIDNDRVLDTRSVPDGYVVRRRRECTNCKRRFTTNEQLEPLDIKVVKKNGVRDKFDTGKLRRGLAKACWKRPISDDQIDGVVARIQVALTSEMEPEISSTRLGNLIMDELRELDQVAYVRFASVYREFTDARDFVEEVRPMLDESHAKDLEKP